MNLIDYLDRGAVLDPSRDCLVMRDGSVRLTYAEVEDLTHRVAAGLARLGIGPGSRIGVYSPNHPMAFVCVLGILRAGATWVAMNSRSSPRDLGALLELFGCRSVIRHPSVLSETDEFLKDMSDVRHVLAMEDIEEWMGPAGTRVAQAPYEPEGLAMLIGTGGTTGAPKGVPVNNRQMQLMALAFNAHMPEKEPPVYVLAAPMTHAAGLAALPVLASGGTVIVHEGVVAEEIFTSIERYRATQLFLPPTAVYTLLAHPDVRQRDFSSLRYFLVAAAPIAADRLAEAVEVFGPVMTQVYGQAEAPFICTFFAPEQIAAAASQPELRPRLQSCGRRSLVADVQIMGEDGRLLPVGERGEIVIRSDLVMRGYDDNEAATAETRRAAGWHGTGDIGYRDADGFIYIVDRKKDMIISGGFNVFPREVEQVIHTFPEVNDCAVIGLPDDKWGEAVTAVIEPKKGQEINPARVIATCREALGPVKTPKSVIIRELPRSPVGKVLKRVLRDEYWEGRSRLV
jgi:acyl-CoA synthetase (AMP-forming)/AMP-acid ligase II